MFAGATLLDFLARRQVLTVMSARGATCARSQVRRNCASPCAARRAPKVQRVTAVGLLERLSARQTWQLCGAAAIATRAYARGGRDAADAQRDAGANSGHGNGHRNMFHFGGHPVMRIVSPKSLKVDTRWSEII